MESAPSPKRFGKKPSKSKNCADLHEEQGAVKKHARKTTRQPGPDLRGMRVCLGCREHFLREDLIRVVCDPEGHLLIDRSLKAPGRGAHLCYSQACIEEALKHKAFGRTFKQNIAPMTAQAFRELVIEAIEGRIRDALAIGRRMGQTVSGTDVLERNFSKLCGLVLSTEASASTKEKLEHLAGLNQCPVWRFGENESLGQSQGKAARVAIGITNAALAKRLALEFMRRDRLSVAT